MTFIGVNVVEVDGVGAPTIVGAATSVAAFNILTLRGIPNTPIRIGSYAKFVERFGSFFDDGLGAYLVKGFFDNGGQNAFISRVTATDAVTGTSAAAITLQDGANDTLTVAAGFRGDEDPGSWGDDLYVSISHSSSASSRLAETAAAMITGSVDLSPTTDMSTFPSLSLLIDGETIATEITLQATDFPGGAVTATPSQIRDAVNARTNKVLASLNGSNQLVLTSTGEVSMVSGGWTSLQFTTADNVILGFTVAATPIFGTAAPTTTGGTVLHTIDEFDVGDAIQITDGPNTAVTKLLSINENSGSVTWAPVVAGIDTWNQQQIVVTNLEFDLAVSHGSSESEDIVEIWTALSMESDVPNYAPAVLNDEIKGSKYVTVDDENSPNLSGGDLPAPTAGLQRLTPGRDGTPTGNDFIGDQSQRTGFYAFDPHHVQLVCCERTDATITTAALAYCAGRGDCMYIGSVPDGYVEAGQAVTFGKAFQGKKVYGALYGPWIRVSDPAGAGENPIKVLPPVGHVAGIYSRIETNRGIWKAPAGDEANLRGVLDVEYHLSDAEHTDLAKSGGVNGIRAIPQSGIVIDASRTLSTDTRWLYVNVRLLFNYVESSLREGLRWVRQEPNRDFLWNTIKFNSVIPFLMGLWRQGAFGTGTPDEVFTVICDAGNNPPNEVDQGNLYVEVYFYPSKPAETIIIKVGQQPSGGSVTEI